MEREKLLGLILERYYAQVAAGVQRFTPPTAPAQPVRSTLPDGSPGALQTADLTVAQTVAQTVSPCGSEEERLGAPRSGAGLPREGSLPPHTVVSQGAVAGNIVAGPRASGDAQVRCEACPIAAARKRCVVSQSLDPRPFLALAEFPEASEESAEILFQTEGSPTKLLTRLFARLGIEGHVHKSFASKCVPRKGVTDAMLDACRGPLEDELRRVDPDIVLCFGARAAHQVARLSGSSLPFFGASPSVELSGRTRRVFTFPSARELEAFPEWRAAVWDVLSQQLAPGPSRAD